MSTPTDRRRRARRAAACLLAAGMAASGAAAQAPTARPLLAVNERPPRLDGRDATGRVVRLASYLGRDRLLVVFAPTTALLDSLRAAAQELTERDLTVLAVGASRGAPAAPTSGRIVGVAVDAATLARWRVAAGAPAFYLVGYDRDLKVARRGLPDAEDVFAVIDGMPMRRAERRAGSR